MKKFLSALLALLTALALTPAAVFTALAVEATKVTGLNVVDGTEGWGTFPIPLEVGQVLLANIQADAEKSDPIR